MSSFLAQNSELLLPRAFSEFDCYPFYSHRYFPPVLLVFSQYPLAITSIPWWHSKFSLNADNLLCQPHSGPCLKLLQWNPCLQRFFSSEIYIPVCLMNEKCYTVLNATSWNLKIWLNVGHSRKNMATLLKALSIEDNDFFTFHTYCIIIKNGIFLVQRIFILSFYIFWPLEI